METFCVEISLFMVLGIESLSWIPCVVSNFIAFSVYVHRLVAKCLLPFRFELPRGLVQNTYALYMRAHTHTHTHTHTFLQWLLCVHKLKPYIF